jgi:hypothetical protein
MRTEASADGRAAHLQPPIIYCWRGRSNVGNCAEYFGYYENTSVTEHIRYPGYLMCSTDGAVDSVRSGPVCAGALMVLKYY